MCRIIQYLPIARRVGANRAHALDNAESAGCEELFMVPATAELAEIDRLADIIAAR